MAGGLETLLCSPKPHVHGCDNDALPQCDVVLGVAVVRYAEAYSDIMTSMNAERRAMYLDMLNLCACFHIVIVFALRSLVVAVSGDKNIVFVCLPVVR